VTHIDQTHYTRAITRLGDHKHVIAGQAIYSDSRIKLMEKAEPQSMERFIPGQLTSLSTTLSYAGLNLDSLEE